MCHNYLLLFFYFSFQSGIVPDPPSTTSTASTNSTGAAGTNQTNTDDTDSCEDAITPTTALGNNLRLELREEEEEEAEGGAAAAGRGGGEKVEKSESMLFKVLNLNGLLGRKGN